MSNPEDRIKDAKLASGRIARHRQLNNQPAIEVYFAGDNEPMTDAEWVEYSEAVRQQLSKRAAKTKAKRATSKAAFLAGKR